MNNIVVCNAPFVRSGNDVNKMFMYLSVALFAPAIYGVMFYGFIALIPILTSIVSCFIFESLFNLITGKKFKVYDMSFFVTALILALTMPYKVPFYVVIASAFVAIFVVKLCFGGLGRNKFNPALVGRCFAGLVSSGLASAYYELTLNGEKFTSLAVGGSNTISNLVLGEAVGGIGTACVLVIAICSIFLIYGGVLDFKIPMFSILSYFVTGLLLTNIEITMTNMFTGSFIFISVFMLTDPNTSPNTNVGKFIYSCLFGSLSALLWLKAPLGENTLFVLALFINVLVPFMDKYFIAKPISLGGFRNAFKN